VTIDLCAQKRRFKKIVIGSKNIGLMKKTKSGSTIILWALETRQCPQFKETNVF
jgi:hypothetical protein